MQRFPKHKVSYKIKKQHNDSFRCVNNSNCIWLEDGAISLPKIGKVDIVLHRKLVSKIRTATVQLRHGKWQVSLTQEVECQPEKQPLQIPASQNKALTKMKVFERMSKLSVGTEKKEAA